MVQRFIISRIVSSTNAMVLWDCNLLKLKLKLKNLGFENLAKTSQICWSPIEFSPHIKKRTVRQKTRKAFSSPAFVERCDGDVDLDHCLTSRSAPQKVNMQPENVSEREGNTSKKTTSFGGFMKKTFRGASTKLESKSLHTWYVSRN